MENNQSLKMATWPVGKLLFSMGLPAVFSMLIQAMYNIVDSIFVSNYSADALFAIGLASPFYMVSLSLALGLATGVGTFVSRRLGEGRKPEANFITTTGFILSLINWLIVLVLALTLSKPFLALFTTRAEIIELGYEYLSIAMVLSLGMHISVLLERVLQSQGDMIAPMIAQLIGAITNIILDPIMIFGMLGCPEMGIKGAAIATVIGQVASAVFVIVILVFKKPEVTVTFKNFKFHFYRVRDIYSVGLPTAVMNMIGSVTTVAMNNVLVRFSEDAVTSLSIYFRLQSFVFMPVFGFNQGALPILSYNYGAMNAKRYKEAVKIFLMTAISIMIVGTLIFQLKPEILLASFGMSESLEAVCDVTLRNISWSFVPASISIVCVTVFQSFGRGTISMVQSILRQVGILIPLAYLLSNLGLNYIWFAYPIAEIVVMIIFSPLAIKTYKEHFNLKSEEN